MPFDLIASLLEGLLGGLAVAAGVAAVIIVSECLTYALLCKKVQEYQKQKNKKILEAKIKEMYPEANKVVIGLRGADKHEETLPIQGSEIAPDIRVG